MISSRIVTSIPVVRPSICRDVGMEVTVVGEEDNSRVEGAGATLLCLDPNEYLRWRSRLPLSSGSATVLLLSFEVAEVLLVVELLPSPLLPELLLPVSLSPSGPPITITSSPPPPPLSCTTVEVSPLEPLLLLATNCFWCNTRLTLANKEPETVKPSRPVVAVAVPVSTERSSVFVFSELVDPSRCPELGLVAPMVAPVEGLSSSDSVEAAI